MKKKIRFINIINDIPLKYKFILIYVFCVIIPMILINVFFLNSFSKYVRQREEKNLNISIDRATIELNRTLENCINICDSISTDSLLFSKLDMNYTSSFEYFEQYYSVLKDRFTKYMSIYNFLSGITIYTSNNTIYNGSNYHKIDNSVINSVWYKAFEKTYDKYYLFFYREPSLEYPTFYTKKLSLIVDLDPYSVIRYNDYILKMDLSLDEIDNIFNSEKNYLSLFLLDNNNNIIYSTTSQNKSKESNKLISFKHILNDKSKPYLMRSIAIGQILKGWKLVGVYDESKILDAIKKPRVIILYLNFAIMIFSTFLISIIVTSYNYRITKLSKHMGKVKKQQFELITINEGKDEIGCLISDFNHMTEKINSLINDVYKLEIQKKDLELEHVRAELNYLQSQINPHFLFNTLNAILVVSTKNNYSSIIDIIRHLSITLRRLLSWKDDLITVEEELSFTEVYMKIEKFRFMDKFEYEIITDEAAPHHKLPKMAIQALVENSCKHGIEAITGIGKVTINVFVQDNFLNVTVSDNGKGMDEERLNELKKYITSNDELSSSIGMRNVYRRLLLNYGPQIKFDIRSEKYSGTMISFSIPIESQN